MNLIDTHSHIYSEEFDEDRAAVIERATTIGVSLILLPAIDPHSSDVRFRVPATVIEALAEILIDEMERDEVRREWLQL